jgi:hypothetical protein
MLLQPLIVDIKPPALSLRTGTITGNKKNLPDPHVSHPTEFHISKVAMSPSLPMTENMRLSGIKS